MIWALLVNFSASPAVEFPCGRVKLDYIEAKVDFNIRLIDGTVGRRGGSPWQVRRKGFFATNSSDFLNCSACLSAPERLLHCYWWCHMKLAFSKHPKGWSSRKKKFCVCEDSCPCCCCQVFDLTLPILPRERMVMTLTCCVAPSWGTRAV